MNTLCECQCYMYFEKPCYEDMKLFKEVYFEYLLCTKRLLSIERHRNLKVTVRKELTVT